MAAMARHPLPPPLLYLSHRVSHGRAAGSAAGGEKGDGTVLYIDDAAGRAFVDWHDGSAPESVPQNVLAAPSAGVIDPVALLLAQVVSGIDSTVIELRSRQEAAALKEAFDYCYYLHNWAKSGVLLVEEIAKVQEEYREVSADKQGASAADVPALEAQCLALEKRFNTGKDAIVSTYHSFFVPQVRIGLAKICRVAGVSASNMLRSDDWAERMQGPAHLYECRFDEVHPAVLPLLRQQQENAAARQAAAAAAVTMPPDPSSGGDAGAARAVIAQQSLAGTNAEFYSQNNAVPVAPAAPAPAPRLSAQLQPGQVLAGTDASMYSATDNAEPSSSSSFAAGPLAAPPATDD
jgi:hypothetical protein